MQSKRAKRRQRNRYKAEVTIPVVCRKNGMPVFDKVKGYLFGNWLAQVFDDHFAITHVPSGAIVFHLYPKNIERLQRLGLKVAYGENPKEIAVKIAQSLQGLEIPLKIEDVMTLSEFEREIIQKQIYEKLQSFTRKSRLELPRLVSRPTDRANPPHPD